MSWREGECERRKMREGNRVGLISRRKHDKKGRIMGGSKGYVL